MARILVAEDDKNTNKLICAVLRRAGHEPLPAFDGQDALDVLDKNHVDLLVSDVMMPRMSGFELTRALRDTGYDLPILMLTAKQGQEALREGFLAGTDDYLTKPADMSELVLRVAALFAAVGRERGRSAHRRRGVARPDRPHRGARHRARDASAQGISAALQAVVEPGTRLHAHAASRRDMGMGHR